LESNKSLKSDGGGRHRAGNKDEVAASPGKSIGMNLADLG